MSRLLRPSSPRRLVFVSARRCTSTLPPAPFFLLCVDEQLHRSNVLITDPTQPALSMDPTNRNAAVESIEDEIIFGFYKKEKVKELKRNLSESALREIKLQAENAELHNGVPFAWSLKIALKSTFGSSMDEKLADSVVGLVEKNCMSMSIKQKKDSEVLVYDVLKLVLGHYISTPNVAIDPHKQYHDLSENYARRPMKRASRRMKENNMQGKVLFSGFSKGEELGKHPIIVEDDDENVHETAKSPIATPSHHDFQAKKSRNVEKSPDIVVLKEVNSKERLEKLKATAEDVYNQSFVHLKNSLAGPSRVSPDMSFVSAPFYEGEGRGVVPAFDSSSNGSKFPVTYEQKRLYTIVCSLASSSKHANSIVADIGLCNLKYFSLGDSMAPGHEVCTFVINCLCRKFFLDERPNISLKHYFFSSVASVFMSDSKDYSAVERSFNGASKVLALPISSVLLFPVLYSDHWFLFIVDLSRKRFLFLDSLYSKNAEFSIMTRKKLVSGFRHAWDSFVWANIGFDEFQYAYPRVPKQQNTKDCGVFVMKFLEAWNADVHMPDVFSAEDIPSLRIHFVNDIVNSRHNIADLDVIRNF